MKFLFFVSLIIAGAFNLNAQYINTDSLVFVPGFTEPLTINEFNSLREVKSAGSGSFAEFFVPGNGGPVISPFGPRGSRMHYGTDIKMEMGDTVKAVSDGVAERVHYAHGFGNLVVIRHQNNITTYYAHLSAFLVKEGTWIKKGDPIGLAGSTGRARGSHLHFEIRENDVPFDAELVFDFQNSGIRKEALQERTLTPLHRTLKPQGYASNIPVPEYYRVKPGDSLWAISRRFKTPVSVICRLNQITENSVLQIGQPLRMF